MIKVVTPNSGDGDVDVYEYVARMQVNALQIYRWPRVKLGATHVMLRRHALRGSPPIETAYGRYCRQATTGINRAP